MTNEELKQLKDNLWNTADNLRANSGLKASEYATPILGLIFLKFIDSKYKKYETEILEIFEKEKGTRLERSISEIAIEKCGFYLPDNAKYNYLLTLPEESNFAQEIKNAMEGIEEYASDLKDVLPKEEYFSLIDQVTNKSVLPALLKNFEDIPTDTESDIFGEVYEYFLGEFALKEGQGGGEFFTPSTVVKYMVEVLAPTEGKILDPACGSGGMFVQTAHYIKRQKEKHGDHHEMNLRAYGVEKTGATVKLAKMNLFLNSIRGDIIEANSYYSDPYESFGNFDYVMANPPFNVDEVNYEEVKDQARFNTFGVPKNKTKSSKKKSDQTEKVPNANYLWISQFATALKENGRAALVMANSASDAGHSEKEIRQRMIESGIVSQMVTLPSNMFNTVTLPATLWFFDKNKKKQDEILFVDARNIFTQVDRAHRKFSDEQIKNLACITRLYQGDESYFKELIDDYKEAANTAEKEETKNYFKEQINWLLERFPEGVYQDVTGLCKAATIEGEDGIKDQDYSLNPGRYVGVVIEDDGMTQSEFNELMLNLNQELQELNAEARELEDTITANLKGLVQK